MKPKLIAKDKAMPEWMVDRGYGPEVVEQAPTDRLPKLTGLTATFSQDEDCCGRVNDPGQDIRVSFPDGGGGPYIVIETERFAFDDLAGWNAFGERIQKLRELIEVEGT